MMSDEIALKLVELMAPRLVASDYNANASRQGKHIAELYKAVLAGVRESATPPASVSIG